MKIIDQLQNPKLQHKIEHKIVAHIITECQKANINPLPLPKFRNGHATFDEPAFEKMVKHLRNGAVIFAQALDEMENNNV